MTRGNRVVAAMPCDCGSVLPYAACCGVYHSGSPAPDAERLMRSRYCAYVRTMEGYLLATWHSSTRPEVLDLLKTTPPKWLGLAVLAHQQSGDQASVEFVARCKVGGRAQRMHEVSRFVREDGRWYYIDGVVN